MAEIVKYKVIYTNEETSTDPNNEHTFKTTVIQELSESGRCFALYDYTRCLFHTKIIDKRRAQIRSTIGIPDVQDNTEGFVRSVVKLGNQEVKEFDLSEYNLMRYPYKDNTIDTDYERAVSLDDYKKLLDEIHGEERGCVTQIVEEPVEEGPEI